MITPQPAQPSRIDYIHPDHLGTPRLVTNASQTIVWRWDSSPFGATDAQQDPDGDNQAFVLNLRFPGQYFDDETGLHYNYFRDYDPTLGRYIESDPIGLNGGLNTYAYVNGSPLRFIDLFGLHKKDKWYGHDDPAFRDWVHDRKQDEEIPGNKNYTKEDLDKLHTEWNDQQCPRGKGGKSGKGGSDRGTPRKRRSPFSPSPHHLPPGSPIDEYM